MILSEFRRRRGGRRRRKVSAKTRRKISRSLTGRKRRGTRTQRSSGSQRLKNVETASKIARNISLAAEAPSKIARNSSVTARNLSRVYTSVDRNIQRTNRGSRALKNLSSIF